MSFVQKFFEGFNFVRNGWRLKGQIPNVWILILIPLLVAVSLLWVGVLLGSEQIALFSQKAVALIFGPNSTGYSQFLYYPLLVIFWLVFVVLYFYVVYILASIISSPFYSVIAEKTLVFRGALKKNDLSFFQTFKNSVKMFWVSLVRGVFLIILGIVLFVVSFVPGLNLLVAFTAFILLAFDSTDYALETQNQTFSQRLRFLRENIVEFMGMGAFIGLTAFVPGLILLVMPFAVIGAADLVARKSSPGSA